MTYQNFAGAAKSHVVLSPLTMDMSYSVSNQNLSHCLNFVPRDSGRGNIDPSKCWKISGSSVKGKYISGSNFTSASLRLSYHF